MNKVLMSLVLGSFALTGVSFAQTTPPAASAPEAAAPVAVKHEKKEHHPELHKAMRKLRGAKQDLEKAAHDYDGHKAKAIELINQALEELKAALGSDKK